MCSEILSNLFEPSLFCKMPGAKVNRPQAMWLHSDDIPRAIKPEDRRVVSGSGRKKGESHRAGDNFLWEDSDPQEREGGVGCKL